MLNGQPHRRWRSVKALSSMCAPTPGSKPWIPSCDLMAKSWPSWRCTFQMTPVRRSTDETRLASDSDMRTAYTVKSTELPDQSEYSIPVTSLSTNAARNPAIVESVDHALTRCSTLAWAHSPYFPSGTHVAGCSTPQRVRYLMTCFARGFASVDSGRTAAVDGMAIRVV
eukprot:scaffold5746_cov138-Isochrysis_galbana.AAC.3